MKCLRRYFCVLFCLVLSLGVFSVGVSAEGLSNYQVYQYGTYPSGTNMGGYIFYPNNSSIEKSEQERNFSGGIPSGNYVNAYRIRSIDGNVLFEGGRKVKASFNNVYYSVLWTVYHAPDTYEQGYITSPTSAYANIMYSDGTSTTSEVEMVKRGDKILNLKTEFTPEKDVQQITFFTTLKNVQDIVPYANTSASLDYDMTFYYGEYNGDDKYQFSFEVSSEEAGLLSGIIEWLKGIWNTITELPVKVWDMFASAFENLYAWIETAVASIEQLPQQIWNFIENGLKSLFIPDEEFMVQFKDDMNELLSRKLGAVYQVISITLESWDRITANDIENTITIPETSINLPDNAVFSFGGYSVEIVPSGFEFLVDIIKTLVGIICTVMFINGLRKKYDEVMGVEQ